MPWQPDTYGTVVYVKIMPFPVLELKFQDPRTGEVKQELFPCKNAATAYKYVEGDQVGISLVGVKFIPGGLPHWRLSEEL